MLNKMNFQEYLFFKCISELLELRPLRKKQTKFIKPQNIIYLFFTNFQTDYITLFFRKAFRQKIYTNKIKSFIPKSKAIFSIMNIVLLRKWYTETYIEIGIPEFKDKLSIRFISFPFPNIHLKFIFCLFFAFSFIPYLLFFAITKAQSNKFKNNGVVFEQLLWE